MKASVWGVEVKNSRRRSIDEIGSS